MSCLLSYGWIAYRAARPAAWGWPALEPGAAGLWAHVSGAAFQKFLGSFNPSLEQRSLLGAYVYPFLFPTLLILIAAVIARRAERENVTFRALAAAALLSTVYAFSYGVPDPSSYFLTPMAIATAALVPAAASLIRVPRAPAAIAAAAGVIAAGLAPAWIRTGGAREKVLAAFDREVHGMWESIPFDRAIVLFANDMHVRLVEYQIFRGEKPNLEIVNPLLLGHPGIRRGFTARHGFDPFAGVDAEALAGPEPRPEEIAEAVGRGLNQNSPLPIILFDPGTGQVRLMRKPGTDMDRR